ncbi:MAG TPA: FlgD immunoglobulin-like domain containing protein [Dongiaceae bacterium]|nr:FlgD immunoglobulin-like domain containing protein [Dongiaceae bacterium]
MPARVVRAGSDPVLQRPHLALLRFALPRSIAGTVAVFNEQGALVRTILSGELAAGEHACAWDGRDEHEQFAPPGGYTVRFEAAGHVLTSRRVVID